MTPAERAALIARAKQRAIPVASCVAARLRPGHLLPPPRTRYEHELLALVLVLAEAADPVTLRAVVEAGDDGGPEVADRPGMLRKAHTEFDRLRKAGTEVPHRLRLLEREYQVEAKRRQREAAAGGGAARAA